MKKVVYNKLIRDKIPEIIEKDGHMAKVRKMDNKEYVLELKKKVLEEANELIKATGKAEIADELADIMELIDCISKNSGLTLKKIQKLKTSKSLTRGGFEKKLFLEHVIEKGVS